MKCMAMVTAIVVIVVLSGCEMDSPMTTSATVASAGPGRTPEVGDMVPNIQGMDTDGVEFELSDYKGKVIMLDFWGDW